VSAAKIATGGKVTILDGKAAAEEIITEQDVQEPAKLARILGRTVKVLAEIARRFNPRRIDYEDVPCLTAGAAIQLQHNFKGRVRWWIVDWTSTGTAAPVLKRNTTTTADTLVLLSYVAGTATIRIEEAG
jgi:hypothetical protein